MDGPSNVAENCRPCRQGAKKQKRSEDADLLMRFHNTNYGEKEGRELIPAPQPPELIFYSRLLSLATQGGHVWTAACAVGDGQRSGVRSLAGRAGGHIDRATIGRR